MKGEIGEIPLIFPKNNTFLLFSSDPFQGIISFTAKNKGAGFLGGKFHQIESFRRIRMEMDKPIKIIHIDPSYQISYFIKRPGSFIRSLLSLQEAVNILKTQTIDLIISEPHKRVILTPQSYSDLPILGQ
jgi:hypothetical protein